jgi:DNA repair protein RadD
VSDAFDLDESTHVLAATVLAHESDVTTRASAAPAQTLRPYQRESLDRARELLASPSRPRVLYVLATGGGKTSVAGDLVRSEVAAGGRVLFIVHRKELADQAFTRFGQFGQRAGVLMGDDERTDRSAPVQVASIQTLVRRAQLDPPPTLVVVDEAHHATAGSYLKVLAAYPNARVLGLTATPWRTDGTGLGDLFQDLVLAATPKQLIEAGFLSRYTGYCYDTPDLKRVHKRGGDFVEGELADVMAEKTLLGNTVSQYLEHAAGKRAICFAVNVKHSQALAERFREQGVPAEHLDGGTARDEREAILERLARGVTLVVCNVGVLTEGFDCPTVEVVILARPTASLGLHLQMIGRALRPAEGKAIARIHDHAGNIFRHGKPDAEHDYTLSPTPKKKKREAGDADDSDGLKSCPACFAIIAASCAECPDCGENLATDKTAEKEAIAIPIELVGDVAPQNRGKRRGPGLQRVQLAFAAHLAYRARVDDRDVLWVRQEFVARFGEEPTGEILRQAQAQGQARYDIVTGASRA